MPSRKPSAKTDSPAQGQGTGRHGDHRHTDPTPTSLRREAAERQAQPTAPAKSESVAKRRNDPEAEAAARGVEPAADGLVRTAKDNQRRRYSGYQDENAILAADRRGEPCSCSATDETPCLAHHALTGRRRWLRPRHGRGWAGRTERRPVAEDLADEEV
jgi:hypothetical protein